MLRYLSPVGGYLSQSRFQATSLIPLAVFPLVNVLNHEQVAAAYGSKLILLMLGGFLLSAAMERSGAHERIALGMVNFFGSSSSRRLVFGFMTASALLSMWISNAATVLNAPADRHGGG